MTHVNRAAELLVSINTQIDSCRLENKEDDSISHAISPNLQSHEQLRDVRNNFNNINQLTQNDIAVINDKITLGKTLFDIKDYNRVVYFLKDCTKDSKRAFFLSSYARFLVCFVIVILMFVKSFVICLFLLCC